MPVCSGRRWLRALARPAPRRTVAASYLRLWPDDLGSGSSWAGAAMCRTKKQALAHAGSLSMAFGVAAGQHKMRR